MNTKDSFEVVEKPVLEMKSMQEIAEQMLILAYVPEADQLSYQDALKLAIERDQEFCMNFYQCVRS